MRKNGSASQKVAAHQKVEFGRKNSASTIHPSIFLRYLNSTRPLWKHLFVTALMMCVVVSVACLLPWMVKRIIDDFIPHQKTRELFIGVGCLFVLYAIRMGATILRNHQMLNFGYHYIYRLRGDLMRHFQVLSTKYYERNMTGDIMNRMLDDVMNVENMTTNSIPLTFESILMLTTVPFILGWMNLKLTLIALVTLPIIYFLHKRMVRDLKERHYIINRNYSTLSSEFHDTVAGVKIVRAFTLEEYKAGSFNKYILEDRRLRINTYTLSAFYSALIEYCTVAGMLGVLVFGGWLAIRGELTSGEVIAFYSYLGFLYNPVVHIGNITLGIQKGLASMKRIYEVLDTLPTPPEIENPLKPTHPIRGEISFENVRFAYEDDDQPAITHITFKVEPGQTVALIGPSGSGKSTIANLINRFYDPQNGMVRLDGHDLRNYQLKWLRSQIALVQQEGFLFWGTIRENIRYGRLSATDDEIEHAAELAHAMEFIRTLPYGLDTPLGEKGVKLSGGQKQRISIARAILKNSPIIILDEATSALDNESESHIQAALASLLKGRSSIVIAHRLSTIRNANLIIAMEKGRIAESGTHDTLLSKNGIYRRLYDLGAKSIHSS